MKIRDRGRIKYLDTRPGLVRVPRRGELAAEGALQRGALVGRQRRAGVELRTCLRDVESEPLPPASALVHIN